MGSFTLTQKARDDMLLIGRYTRKQWGKTQQRRYLIQLDAALLFMILRIIRKSGAYAMIFGKVILSLVLVSI